MKKALIFISIFSIICCEILVRDSASFGLFKTDLENKVRAIVKKVENLNSDAAFCGNITQCTAKSYDQCAGVGAKSCLDWFPASPTCTTTAYFSTQTSIGFPLVKETSKNWTDEDKNFICLAPLLNPIFNSTQADNHGRFVKTYFGSATGGIVRYPGEIRSFDAAGTCQDYDPRGRPWYTAAISSAKFVVIIINSGTSMNNNNRLSITITDVNKILKTLSNKDYVLILSASDDSIPLGFSNVVVGNSANIANFSSAITNNLTVQTSLMNYNRAFEKAFKLLDQSVTNGIKPSCPQPVVSFLLFSHEGIANSSQVFQNVSSIIDSKSSSYQSRVFTFNMLSGSESTTVLQDLACKYQGASFQINGVETSSVFLDHINFYNTILADGISTTNPIWTEPYEDAWGYGQMITVSMPAYKYQNSSNSSIKIVLGVVAIDVLLSYIPTLGVTISEALIQLGSSPTCFVNTLNNCELEALRKQNNQGCGLANCSLSLSPQSCVPATSQLFLTAVSTDNNTCCSSPISSSQDSTLIIVLSVLGGVLFIVFVSIGVWCCYSRRNLSNNLLQSPPSSSQIINSNKELKGENIAEIGGFNINPGEIIPHVPNEVLISKIITKIDPQAPNDFLNVKQNTKMITSEQSRVNVQTTGNIDRK